MEEELRLKRIGRHLSYKGSIMEIYKDDMLMPDGRVVQWDYFDHEGGSAVVPVLPDGRILMVRQYRNALDMFTLEIPAGAFDEKNEDPIICAGRELEEETGYKSENIFHLMDMHSLPAFTNEKVTIFAATDLVKGRQKLDDQEFLNVETYALDDLISMIYAGEITDSKTVCGLFAYKLWEKQKK